MRTCGGASWSTTRRRCTGFDVPHHADPRSRRMTAPVRGGHAKADRFDRPVEEAPRTGSAAASRSRHLHGADGRPIADGITSSPRRAHHHHDGQRRTPRARTQNENNVIAMSTVEPIPDSTTRTANKRSVFCTTPTPIRLHRRQYTPVARACTF